MKVKLESTIYFNIFFGIYKDKPRLKFFMSQVLS
jgi:hypothetical protein